LEDLGVLARVPLASGYLSGEYGPGSVFDNQDDVRSRENREDREKKLEQVQQIQRKEVPVGGNMATWALAWCLQHPAASCVIPGCKTVEQVEANASAAGLDIVRENHPQGLA
jgi:aryl-alcohol dehydrogenase-like predicted oxidoreductase